MATRLITVNDIRPVVNTNVGGGWVPDPASAVLYERAILRRRHPTGGPHSRPEPSMRASLLLVG
jgi:hypothetical protein